MSGPPCGRAPGPSLHRVPHEAETHLHRALTLAEEIASRGGITTALLNLGDVATRQGRYERAEEHLRESVLLATTLGGICLLLGNLAEQAKLESARLGGAEAQLLKQTGNGERRGNRTPNTRIKSLPRRPAYSP